MEGTEMRITRTIAITGIATAAVLGGAGIASANVFPTPTPTPTITQPGIPTPVPTPPTIGRRCSIQFDRIQLTGVPFGTRVGQWDRVCVRYSPFGFRVTVTPLTLPVQF